jgi:hypothetical protein
MCLLSVKARLLQVAATVLAGLQIFRRKKRRKEKKQFFMWMRSYLGPVWTWGLSLLEYPKIQLGGTR